MTAAAFKACYSDFKLVKTRSVVQLIFEVPLHESTQALEAVGGMPDAAAERWFAIARLKEVMPTDKAAIQARSTTTETAPASEDGTTPARARKSWDEIPPSQQAGILCDKVDFQVFIAELLFPIVNPNEVHARRLVLDWCHVDSRSKIRNGTEEAELWRDLVEKYRTWQLAAQVVPT